MAAMQTVTAMQTVSFEHLWVDGVWRADVALDIEDGRVRAVHDGPASAAQVRIGGLTLPGLADAHCHAFQRLLAPWTQRARRAQEDFWSWRQSMYAAAAQLGAEELEAIAARCFVDLLRGGYTGVAEFLYLHRLSDRDDRDAAAPDADRAIAAAAASAGIRLMLLPALYQRADFGAERVSEGQQPFRRSVERFLADWDELKQRYAPGRSGAAATPVTLGIAFHSLRAVDIDTILALCARVAGDASCRGLHMHVAEQGAEVSACMRHHGRPPVGLLAKHGLLDARWTLVHGVHTTLAELEQLAHAQATLAVCPTTESDLADGLAEVGPFLAAGGRLAIGSDSNIARSALAELRTLEWGLRLKHGRRNVLASSSEPAVADRLFRAVLQGGWHALGAAPSPAALEGTRADFVSFDADEGDWRDGPPENFLSALVFGAAAPEARDVMVAGRWVIREGVHAAEISIDERYRATLQRLKEPLRQALLGDPPMARG